MLHFICIIGIYSIRPRMRFTSLIWNIRRHLPKQFFLFRGKPITTLKVSKLALYIAFQPWEKLRENQLVVGSIVNDKDEGECGVMRIYDVPTLMGPLEKKKEYTELGKIVDIVYRDRD